MGMLNNWDVGGGVSDFWDDNRQPRPQRWTSWGVAVVLAPVVFWGFGKYLIPYEQPSPHIPSSEHGNATPNQDRVDQYGTSTPHEQNTQHRPPTHRNTKHPT